MPTPRFNAEPGLFIDGHWQAGEHLLEVIAPATEAPLAAVAGATAADVERAVAAASRAFDGWATTAPGERAACLRRIAQGLAEQREALLALQCANNGKPRFEAELDVDDAIATFEYYAGLAASQADAEVPLPVEGFSARLRREACGVVGLIVPWNFPMVTTAWKLAPALAAGCTVLLKPSEVTPLAELAMARIVAASGLPAGVFNVLCGTGEAVGSAMAAHPGIAKISFTGSNAVGVRVMQSAAHTVKGVSLELGGKSALLVLEDADLDQAVTLAAGGGFFNAGQMCSATSRVLVAAPLYEAFLARLVAAAEAMQAGTDIGPLVNATQYQRVLAHVRQGQAAGAVVRCGGGRPAHLRQGYFIAPTVFTEVPLASALWREEIFGPVLCVRPFADLDEAVRLANDTEYGLVASVVGGDDAVLEAVANRLRAGTVWLNSPQAIFPQTAWGGYKQSSLGRELGPWGLAAFQEVKHVVKAGLG